MVFLQEKNELIDGFNQTSLSLTDLYLFEINKQNKKDTEIEGKVKAFASVPKEVTEEGFDEAKFVSMRSNLSLPHTSWLPVKETKENHANMNKKFIEIQLQCLLKMNLKQKVQQF